MKNLISKDFTFFDEEEKPHSQHNPYVSRLQKRLDKVQRLTNFAMQEHNHPKLMQGKFLIRIIQEKISQSYKFQPLHLIN
jgi:hypothetical protein